MDLSSDLLIDADGAYNDALDRIKTRPMIIPRPKTLKEKEGGSASRVPVTWASYWWVLVPSVNPRLLRLHSNQRPSGMGTDKCLSTLLQRSAYKADFYFCRRFLSAPS